MKDERRRAALVTLVLMCLAAAGILRGASGPIRNETCANYEDLTNPDLLDVETSRVKIDGFPRQRRMDGLVVSARPLPHLAFTIRRTYGLPAWLFRPTLAIPGPKEPDHTETRTIQVDGKPVDVRMTYARHRIRQRFAVYTFGFKGASTLSPFWRRVIESPIAAFAGPSPITFIGIAGDADSINIPKLESQALEFMTAAWRLYEDACNP